MNQPNERQQATQRALLKLLATPPESLLSLFERLEIPWQKMDLEEGTMFMVKWKDLMAGEKRNQTEGPFIKKLVEELKHELASDPTVFPPAEPTEHKVVEIPPAFKRAQDKKRQATQRKPRNNHE